MTYSDFEIHIPQGRLTGQVYTTCPKCSHDRKKKTDKCLGVNLDKAIWHCNHCQWKGSLTVKTYQVPKWENKTGLSDKVTEWFLKRNISQQTLIEMRVTESKEFMPQVSAERNVICFNYFREGQLVNVKYRDGEKNFKMFKDGELIFYNLDGIKDSEEAYIVEGEMDCLTMIHAGFKNTVSVPNGANKGSNNLQYMDNCYKYFENIKTVYIMTDNDEPGIKLGEELARRIGLEKCYRVDLGVYKDINEAYGSTGKIDLSVKKAFPLAGITNVDDHWDKFLYILKNGFPKGWKPRGGLGELVQFHPGYTTIFTGIPGHGKSEMLDQILVQLCIDYNLRGGYFSPENRPTELHVIKLVEKVLGKSAWKANEMELVRAKSFLGERLFWIYPDEGYDLDNVLEKVRQAVLRYGISWFVIDPWNKLEHQYTQSETKYISESLDKIANFNHKNGTHCFIVAHPTKMKFNEEEGKYAIPGLYDISGSANFFNKADIGMCIYKENVTPNEYKNTLLIQKVKFKFWGAQGNVNYTWDSENGRYNEFGRDLTNWINQEPKPKLINWTEPQREEEVPF